MFFLDNPKKILNELVKEGTLWHCVSSHREVRTLGQVLRLAYREAARIIVGESPRKRLVDKGPKVLSTGIQIKT